MWTPARENNSDEVRALVEDAAHSAFSELQAAGLMVEPVIFDGTTQLFPSGRVDPLDWLDIGLGVKVDRKLNFLLIFSDADIAGTKLSYALAFPSRLTNVGIISIRRLMTEDEEGEAPRSRSVARLKALLLHTFGHILNLAHSDTPASYMSDFSSVGDLDRKARFEPVELDQLGQNLETEAHDETRRGSTFAFWLSHVWENRRVVASTLRRAHPFRLMSKLPTTMTAALSVVVVLFFSAEIWDVADTVAAYQIWIFTLIAFTVATLLLYRTFGFRTVFDRDRSVSESTVVTQTTTALAVAVTVLVIYLVFLALTYVAAVTIFPRPLMEAWASVDSASETADHLKLGMFLAAMAVLTGSLGGRSDSRSLVRTILFLDEET